MILQPIYPQVIFGGENSCQKMMMQNKNSIIRSVRGTILHNSRGIIPKFIANNPSRRLLIMITASQSSSPVRFINKVTGESCAFVSERKLYLVATRLAHFTHVCQFRPTKTPENNSSKIFFQNVTYIESSLYVLVTSACVTTTL